MRRVVAIAIALVLMPASTALAAELDELLDDSREASYTAEQVISCSTPDGVRDAVVEISQTPGELHVGAPVDPDVEVASGYGGWTLVRGDSVVSSANVESGAEVSANRYAVDGGTPVEYLGREAVLYEMLGDGVVRAELVFDAEVGALVRVTTFTGDGHVYCERRFISFDPGVAGAGAESAAAPDPEAAGSVADSDLPENLDAFERLDVYEDDEGFVFAYYSDGFFSFAVFQTPSVVSLEDGTTVSFDSGAYTRAFTPGQATFVWETRTGGMAVVGDLPPDMHEAVLAGLPTSVDPGLFRRLWRSLFG
jgi:hypothetical protein